MLQVFCIISHLPLHLLQLIFGRDLKSFLNQRFFGFKVLAYHLNHPVLRCFEFRIKYFSADLKAGKDLFFSSFHPQHRKS